MCYKKLRKTLSGRAARIKSVINPGKVKFPNPLSIGMLFFTLFLVLNPTKANGYTQAWAWIAFTISAFFVLVALCNPLARKLRSKLILRIILPEAIKYIYLAVFIITLAECLPPEDSIFFRPALVLGLVWILLILTVVTKNSFANIKKESKRKRAVNIRIGCIVAILYSIAGILSVSLKRDIVETIGFLIMALITIIVVTAGNKWKITEKLPS